MQKSDSNKDKTSDEIPPQPGPSPSPNGQTKEEIFVGETVTLSKNGNSEEEEEVSVEGMTSKSTEESSQGTDSTEVLTEEVLNVVAVRHSYAVSTKTKGKELRGKGCKSTEEEKGAEADRKEGKAKQMQGDKGTNVSTTEQTDKSKEQKKVLPEKRSTTEPIAGPSHADKDNENREPDSTSELKTGKSIQKDDKVMGKVKIMGKQSTSDGSSADDEQSLEESEETLETTEGTEEVETEATEETEETDLTEETSRNSEELRNPFSSNQSELSAQITSQNLEYEESRGFETTSEISSAELGNLAISFDSTESDETTNSGNTTSNTDSSSRPDKLLLKRRISSDSEDKSDTTSESALVKKGRLSISEPDSIMTVAVSESPESESSGQTECSEQPDSSTRYHQESFIGYALTSHSSTAPQGIYRGKFGTDILTVAEKLEGCDITKDRSALKRKLMQEGGKIGPDFTQVKMSKKADSEESDVKVEEKGKRSISPSEKQVTCSAGEEAKECLLSKQPNDSDFENSDTQTKLWKVVAGKNIKKYIDSTLNRKDTEASTSNQGEDSEPLPEPAQPDKSILSRSDVPTPVKDLCIGDSILDNISQFPPLPSPTLETDNISNNQELDECIIKLDAACPDYLKNHPLPEIPAENDLPSPRTAEVQVIGIPTTSESTYISDGPVSSGPSSSEDDSEPVTIAMATFGPNSTTIPQLIYDGINWLNYKDATKSLWKFFINTPNVVKDPASGQLYSIKKLKFKMSVEVSDDIVSEVSQKCHIERKEVRKAIKDISDKYLAHLRTNPNTADKGGPSEDADDEEEESGKENSSKKANSGSHKSD